ncbi:hypothetical protein [Labilithrix luteola]|uniref:hypothetical protein n=1 Tax=Labilithrix luteola TaxID=1391654 RepID=UPI0011BAAD79|nr:hypothetical protein [Labilithrix luteola]
MANHRIKTSNVPRVSRLAVLAVATIACGSLSPGLAFAQSAQAASAERAVSAKLGLDGSFFVGLGNDAAGNDPNANHAYTLGPKLDVHYMYLSGLDWPSWNAPEGNYVTVQANAARDHGMVPMFTLYQAAAYGEGNLGAFNTTDFMTRYWHGVRVMFQRLGEFDAPAIVHLEPDLWGYAQQKGGDDPAAVPMKVGSVVPECQDLPENVAGMASCAIRLSRTLAPKAVVGLSASTFGATTTGKTDPARVAGYLAKLGADADIVVVETLDRDAGCFEVGSDPNCHRSGNFYWTDADFDEHLAWANTIRTVTGKPLVWWQMPLGVPSESAGSSAHYRDNRVQYLFSHPARFAQAGGIGAVFGTGARNQTDATTDGGQFRNAVTGYRAAPVPLL